MDPSNTLMFEQDFNDWSFPRFLQGPYLKTALTMLPHYAKDRVWIMVPYLIQGELLHSILTIHSSIEVLLLTRDHSGYLPNIKSGAQPALNQLRKQSNLTIYINNSIHAKILLVDTSFCVVHSMNGTPRSETSNYEAGLVAITPDVIEETEDYFRYVISQSRT